MPSARSWSGIVRYGASPRGMQAMILAGKIMALMDERYNVAFDDIRQAAVPALRHRLIMNFEAQAEGINSDPGDPRPCASRYPPRNNSLSAERLFSEAFLRRLERLALLSRQAASSQMQGERRSPSAANRSSFPISAPMCPGDDFRRIDWNAYARLERLFIKLFVEEEDATLHLLVDASRSMDWGEPNKLRYAIQVAGALGYIALAGLDRVTVSSTRGLNGYANTYFPPVRGKQSAAKLFSFLLSISPCLNPIETNTWLTSFTSKAINPGVVVLISDLMSDGWESGLSLLRGQRPRCLNYPSLSAR